MARRAVPGLGSLTAAAIVAATLLAPTVAAPVESAPRAAEVIDARIVGDGTRTRFVADVSGPVDMSVFTLGDPYRVVIDLPEVRFALTQATGRQGRGLVSSFRYGQITKGRSRVILDMTGPGVVEKAFVLPPVTGQPGRLVVDIVPASIEAFTASLKAREKDRPAPVEHAVAKPQSSPKGSKPVIVLDPGHGGIDSGAVGARGTLEKDVTLKFAEALAKVLKATGRYEVLMTRSDDTFIPLGERVAIARRQDAQLFVSLHADSFRGDDVRGATVYTLSERASNAMAAAIAEGENKSDIIGGVDKEEIPNEVADILLDLARRDTKNSSIVLARSLVNEMRPSVRLFKNPHQQAGFVVLKAPDVPSALVELGFLSSAEDEKLLISPAWRDKTAESIAGAIETFIETRTARAAQ